MRAAQWLVLRAGDAENDTVFVGSKIDRLLFLHHLWWARLAAEACFRAWRALRLGYCCVA